MTTLEQQLKSLLGRERESLVQFLLLLGEFDADKRFLDCGYASLWDFVRRALGQSEAMTHYRVNAARALRRFPQALEPLRDGRLCMTTLASLSSVLTDENCNDVLHEATGKTKNEILRLKARFDPKPVPMDTVVTLPALPTETKSAESVLCLGEVETSRSSAAPLVLTAPEVLTEELTRRHMTTDREFEKLLVDAKAALSHKMPGASDVEILKEGLRLLVAAGQKRKGLVDKPRESAPERDTKEIPARVKRLVWTRDQGKCQWPTSDGKVCGATTRVEFHHIYDRGKGGAHTAENLMLLCKTHNQHAADQSWGKEHMERFRQRALSS